MGIFKKKDKVLKKLVMYKNGIPNFINADVVIEMKVDETNKCIIFKTIEDNVTAKLDMSKIICLELGEKGNTVSDSSVGSSVIGGIVGGTTGAIIGSAKKKKPAFIPTLKIKYESDNIEKEINLYQCNYYSEGSIELIKSNIEKNIRENRNIDKNIEL